VNFHDIQETGRLWASGKSIKFLARQAGYRFGLGSGHVNSPTCQVAGGSTRRQRNQIAQLLTVEV